MYHFQIVAHGCHFRVVFKFKGFSANPSLKRTAVIVDAPDLAPEDAEFFITAVGVADSEKIDIPKSDEVALDFELLEDEVDVDVSGVDLIEVKGIGAAVEENLKSIGIGNVEELIVAEPEEVADKLGKSIDLVQKWQKSARTLLV